MRSDLSVGVLHAVVHQHHDEDRDGNPKVSDDPAQLKRTQHHFTDQWRSGTDLLRGQRQAEQMHINRASVPVPGLDLQLYMYLVCPPVCPWSVSGLDLVWTSVSTCTCMCSNPHLHVRPVKMWL